MHEQPDAPLSANPAAPQGQRSHDSPLPQGPGKPPRGLPIRFDGVGKHYGVKRSAGERSAGPHHVQARHATGATQRTGHWALRHFSLSVRGGEFLSLLGPSGCGKSTVLKLAAGLESPSEGQVGLNETHSAGAGGVAYVFQDATLLPWSTVFDNVWLPLRLAGVSRDAASERIMAQLHRVGLAHVAHHHPDQLSGGMKMRVSLARALVTQPRLLLLDEPFAALDEITRQRLGQDLLALWQELGFTVMFVTHSVFEAAFLSQRVVVMGAAQASAEAGIGMAGAAREFSLHEAYPRSASYRGSPTFAHRCLALSQALEAASTGPSMPPPLEAGPAGAVARELSP